MAEQPTPVENTNEPVVAAAHAAVSAPVDSASVPKVAEAAPAASAVESPKVPPAAPVSAEPAKVADTPKTGEPPVVPDKYDLKVGATAVSPQLLDAITPLFKEAGMTNAQAQGLADAFAAHQKAQIPQIMARDLDTLRADPELGKLNFGRTQARVNDALAAFSTPTERQALTDMGLANNPTLVRLFHRIGSAMQEPPQTDAGHQPREKLPTQSKLYGGRDRVESGRSN